MADASTGHDREATLADPEPTSVLDAALADLRLDGAIFLRGDYTEAWAYESMRSSDAAAILAPEAERVLLFHVVAAGRCWIETEPGRPHWANAGDVIVLPYNDEHRMGGVDTTTACVGIGELIDPPPWDRMPVIRHGGGGRTTRLVCGYLTCQDPLFDPRLRVFPPVFVVTPPEGAAREWVRTSIDFALQQARVSADRLVVPTGLPELLLVEIIRLHLATVPSAERGWIHAINDPGLAPALAAMHGSPEHHWTVRELAYEAGVSASLLDDRFRTVLGLAPIRYLTEWRMHVAEELLLATDLGVAAIARRVGYDAEEAFSRAFKRTHGAPPSRWRTSRR